MAQKTPLRVIWIETNRQYLTNLARPFQITLNEADFRAYVVRACAEHDQDEHGVDEWIQPQVMFEFVFCEDECNCVAFEGIHSAVPNNKYKHHVIDAKWRGIMGYWKRNDRVMKWTCGLAREILDVRRVLDEELREELVFVEGEELAEKPVIVERRTRRKT